MTTFLNIPTAPPGVEDDPERDTCCLGAIERGAAYCTCWVPVFDLEQAGCDLDSEPSTRSKCCADCAFRQGSPERAEVDDDPAELVPGSGEFWCHLGVRRAIAYRHPDGREVPAPEGDYQPPVGRNANGEMCIWKADGTAGERCAGWAAAAGNSLPLAGVGAGGLGGPPSADSGETRVSTSNASEVGVTQHAPGPRPTAATSRAAEPSAMTSPVLQPAAERKDQ